jgi:hypothetical protein
MAKKSQSCPEFIQQMDWPIIILILFLVIFLGGITLNHYFTQQQQLRWEKLAALRAEESAQTNNIIITAELLEQADLNQDGQINQTDVEIMQAAFFNIDSESLLADLNQDGRVDTADYALLVQIITRRETDNNGQ